MTGPAVAADTVIRPAKADTKEPVPEVSVPGVAVGDGADANGWLPLGFNPAVVDTLSTLYGHWTSGLRELYANLVASCKRARSEYGADPAIAIEIDGRTVTLADVDSCGMSRRVFEEGIAVAGNTGNDDPLSPGQWGLGSLSFVMVADEMLIESHSRATGERFSVRALRGGRFVTGGLPEPGFAWHGTRMTLQMRDGLRVEKAIEAIVKISAMSGVPTALRVRGAEMRGSNCVVYGAGGGKARYANGLYDVDLLEERRSGGGGGGEKEARACADAPPAPVPAAIRDYMSAEWADGGDDDRGHVVLGLGGRSMREKIAAALGRAGYDVGTEAAHGSGDSSGDSDSGAAAEDRACVLNDGGGIVVIHAENDDLEVAAAIGIRGRRGGNRGHGDDPVNAVYRAGDDATWLAGMPIKAVPTRCFGRFTSCVYVHAKNERVYRPTPDRERLTDESAKRLSADVSALVACEIAKAEFATLGEYLSDYGNRIAEAAFHLEDTWADAASDGTPRATLKSIDGLPPTARRRSKGRILDDDKARIVLAAAGPIMVFGSRRGSRHHTLWSAVRCGRSAGGAAMGHPHRCRMASGGAQGGGKEPILIVARALTARKAAAVVEWCAGNKEDGRRVVVFRPARDNPYSADEYAMLGAEQIDAYMARHGIKALSAGGAEDAAGRVNDPATLAVYGAKDALARTHGYVPASEAKKIDPAKAGENVVWCDNRADMDAMKSIVSVILCGMQAARCGRRPGRATPFADYARKGEEAEYDTTAGRLSGSAIARTGRRIVLVEYDGDAADLADLLRAEAAQRGTLLPRNMRGWYSDGGRRGPAWTRDASRREKERLHRMQLLPPMVVVGRAPELSACAAHLHSAGARFGVHFRGRYGGPRYIQRVSGGIDEYLGSAEPEWLGHLWPSCRTENEARTLVASALHGHLANRHRRGPRGSGAGAARDDGGGAGSGTAGAPAAAGGRP